METHLTIKHIAPYLPYGLKYGTIEKDWKTLEDYLKIRGELSTRGNVDNLNNHIDNPNTRLILRPLSDLTKEIQIAEYYMTYKEHIQRMFPTESMHTNIATWSYRVVDWLFEWHFDVFGLIPQNLAIDINTLEP